MHLVGFTIEIIGSVTIKETAHICNRLCSSL